MGVAFNRVKSTLKTRKMKTEFKDVAKYYLGTGLKCRIQGVIDLEFTIKGIQEESVFYYNQGNLEFCYLENVKPLMHSLDKLTEPITVEGYNDGDEFVPIKELEIVLSMDWCGSFDDFLDYLHDSNYDGDALLQGSFKIIHQLIQWHFNVFGVDCIDK